MFHFHLFATLQHPLLHILVLFVLRSIVVVQLPSHVQLFATQWITAHQASLSLTILWSLPKFMSIASMMPYSHLICWGPLLLPSIFPSIMDFSNKSVVLIKWPKYWHFRFSISPSNEYSGLISLKIDWFDDLAVQENLRNLLLHQFEGIISLVLYLLYGPAFTTIHDHCENHSLDCIDLCHQSNVSAFNIVRFVIAFLPRSKSILISWLQQPSTIILEPK